MASQAVALSGKYVLATGASAVGRLNVLHKIYSPAGRQALIGAGLKKGMRVADFGCGPGTMSRMLAAMVGPGGRVTGVDLHSAQIEQARMMSADEDLAKFVSGIERPRFAQGLRRPEPGEDERCSVGWDQELRNRWRAVEFS